MLDQNGNRIGVIGAAVWVIGIDKIKDFAARDSVWPASNQIDDALAHRPAHDESRRKRPPAGQANLCAPG